MMRLWTVLSQKGGAGKTTLVLHLAIAATARGRETAVFDLDPQRSADHWSDFRQTKTTKHDPAIVHGVVDNLEDMLKAAEDERTDLVLIDTPPAVDKTMILTAARADMIIVPSRTSVLDRFALKDTLKLLKATNALSKVVVLIVGEAGKSDAAKALIALAVEHGVTVVAPTLDHRLEYSQSLGAGQGVSEAGRRSKAAQELESIYQWLANHDERPLDGKRKAKK
jgi:chromosome partitioning protein